MRIISGLYKGRVLKGYNIEGTRPTMDRVKESIFGSIQTKVKGSIVLDLFAGSGSLGIEALSQGAIECYFVDKNIKVINILKNNLKQLNITSNVICDDYKNALKKLEGKKFDIILLDPPYKLNLINDSLNLIDKYDLLNDEGIIICEYETEEIITDKYKLIREKRFGSTYVKIYKK